ncbi:hypothetical protein [Pyxidicoccus xibeiensis]|uniref:hypothetical protein n=1 Tax=Pyxidicoccus xibeiensis TaxID=2906759 RepID=UPI0020A78BF8|nr:hypothetical protein [Pyxidicoccus xibeiensis]MCP3142480.1 hypothetical protein [Pyxidicoccus xibeiensis]
MGPRRFNRTRDTLTAIVPVRSEPELLEARLARIGDDIRGNPHIPFQRLETAHFLSWVLVPGPRDVHGTEGAPRLVCEASFEGPRDVFLRELHREAGDALRAQLYSHCEQAPGADADGFEAFFRAHSREAAFLYTAYPGLPAHQIDEDDRAHWYFHRLIVTGLESTRPGLAKSARGAEDVRADQLVDLCHGFVAQALGGAAMRSRLPPGSRTRRESWRTRLGRSLPVRVLRTSPILPSVVVAALLLGQDVLSSAWEQCRARLGHRAQPRRTPRLERLHAREDLQGQNHLTHYVALKPGLLRRPALRMVLWGWGRLAKLWFTQGHLGGIEGIHFARWLLIDGGRQAWPALRWPLLTRGRHSLLFFSNYDGSWENYLGSFIDRGGIGLTTIWCNTQGFPKTRLRWTPSKKGLPFTLELGSDRAEAFKQWVREHQLPTLAWYSRHPDKSVANIRRNREIRSWADVGSDPLKRRQWLQLL